MTRAAAVAVVVGLVAIVASVGCDGVVQREYVYTRREPAAGRKSPTVYVVRLRIDKQAKTVVWFEDVHDSEGNLGRTTKTWTGCIFLDDFNWQCDPVSTTHDFKVVDEIEMRDGQLRQQYWGEDRVFQVRRRMGRVG